MAKHESPVMVFRELQRRGTTNILAKACNYINILETGLVGDRARTRRSSTSNSLVHSVLRMKQSIDKIIFED